MRLTNYLLSLFAAPLMFAHEGHSHNAATTQMTAAAQAFLASLEDAQKKVASFDFKDTERENWHFIPMNDRKGLRLDAMRPHQRHLAFGLLATGLSQKGFMTASQIMTLEQILQDRGESAEVRNPEKYHVSIFGVPSQTDVWGWRFEGHHISLNFSLLGDQIIGLPAFFGTNPAELRKGPLKGMRPLGEIEDAARSLAEKLIEGGSSPVFSNEAPKEILTAQDRVALAQEIQGVASSEMTGENLKSLLGIIYLVADFQRREVSNENLHLISITQRKKLHFAWGGSLKKGEGHYFRIQGTNFMIEYANTQNDANHAHLVWRDLENDFARDSLKEHYQAGH